MEQFAYSFAITMMHSIWQMALLLLCYWILTTLVSPWTPLAKRNLLFVILAGQFFCTIFSFYIVHSAPFSDFRQHLQGLLTSLSVTQNWLYSYAGTLSFLYILVVLYKLSNSFVQWMGFRTHYKSMLVKPSIDLRLFTQTKAYHFGIDKKVTIWFSENVHSPMTFGFLKPVILLPVALVNQLSLEQTESLIIHELTHIKNNDFILNWFLVTMEALYFFNPFVKIVADKIRLEREKNCDVQVLQFKYPAIEYAETLLHTAQQQQLSYTLQLSAVKNKAELLQRIKFFTAIRSFDHPAPYKFPFAVIGIGILILINLVFAGYLLRDKQVTFPGDISAGVFTAMPANEWNKSFTGGGSLATDQTATAAKPRSQKVEMPSAGLVASKRVTAVESEFTNSVETADYEEFMATPVSFTDESMSQQNELVIKEEISSGKIITKFYQLKTINGEMMLEPLWMTAELMPLSIDSARQKIKSDSNHIFKLVPTIQ